MGTARIFDAFFLTLVLLTSGSACVRGEREIAVQWDGGAKGTPFSAPTLVTGLRAETVDVHDPSLTGDEREIYFSSRVNGQSEIWSSTRVTATSPWKPAIVVNELSGPMNEIDPDVSPDGLLLYFSSDRGGDGPRLYAARRAARTLPWEAPVELSGLGTSTEDTGPSVDPTSPFMVFASLRGGAADPHLFTASRLDALITWTAVAPMSGVNSDRQDENPALFDTALSLIFSSRRTMKGATSDLFETSRSTASVPFTNPAIPLDSLNLLEDWEGDAWVSQDGHHILFVSDRNAGISQIFEAWR